MKISCNKLKQHIKNADEIDWLKIWDTFTIRTAEVEEVTIKGTDMDKVVVAEVIECVTHPKKENYHLLKVNYGSGTTNILCGANNVRVGLKTALVPVGGKVSGITIEAKKIAGFESAGMLCSVRELGIGDDHDGIVEFPEDWVVGKSIKEYLPIDDIVVEIDNKSLTNRPDLWGHYGIAREIAAITNHELLPLETLEVPTDLEDLKVKIKDPDLCLRYTGVKVDHITNNKTPLEMQIFLYYAGMRSISLLVDLTNYVMLELGQPMHAFDARVVKEIEVGRALPNDTYTTLDGVKRNLTDNMLMIKNGKDYFGIAGVMGGLDSEILPDTTSIVLESATFDATSVRKTATALGLRTEASARYEKSLDPHMASEASKRFLYLLKQENEELEFASNLTDVFPNPPKAPEIILTKEKLTKYMGKELEDDMVVDILESLSFKVRVKKDHYIVTVPTFRATKDITLEADLIEEISRMYGYENFELTPLKCDLTFANYENIFEQEYEAKYFLANKYHLSEVHSYLWYKTEFLKTLKITKENVSLLGKSDDNILRDDLSLSLLEIAEENLKYLPRVSIFEIGTIIIDNENKRSLSILLCDEITKIEELFQIGKTILTDLFQSLKNEQIILGKEPTQIPYYDPEICYNAYLGKNKVGSVHLLNNKQNTIINKKKAFVLINIDFDSFVSLNPKATLYEDVSKYPTVELDYTVILGKEDKYEVLENVLQTFTSPIILDHEMIGIYEDNYEKRITIRYHVGSSDKTLSNLDLGDFKNQFIKHIKDNGLGIVS